MRTFAILLTAAKDSGKRVFAVIQFAIGKDNGECNKKEAAACSLLISVDRRARYCKSLRENGVVQAMRWKPESPAVAPDLPKMR